MRLAICLTAMLLAVPALAQDLPQFPKAGPPEPLPEAICDTTIANNGEWLVGRWVAPQTKWEFARKDGRLAWAMDRKGSIANDFGWTDGTQIGGLVDQASGCTVALSGGEGVFKFEGVLSDGGKLYGFATNKRGEHVRFILRRER
ncbi:conserved exported hypothetical protein [Magnetospirillum sp. LM-5]|uniref:hypothetical protein n=1 Tax=Magnetospirillum sp. LM-5 TaxID=2681466 RepID=UPI001383A120|nr:hypothetical protein [Magnetospirillum sp. LM-5]CAA7616458.1 conserved exported hypothetical protein [Magnetospirillum sp. LM-5]